MSNAAKSQHEHFDVKQDTKRTKVIRQDRLNVEDLDCWMECDGQRHQLLNISAFGAAFISKTSMVHKPEFRSSQFGFADTVFSETSMRFAREFQDEEGRYIVGLETVGEPINTARLHAVQAANELVDGQKEEMAKMAIVPDEFRRRVLEIRDWLQSLQLRVNEVAAQGKEMHTPDFEDTFAEVVSDYLAKMMPAKNEQLNHILPTKDPEILKASIEYFRTKLYDLIYQAPFSDRVFHKPLGYAGDYEMMNIIYREKANGKSLFAKCLNCYWVNQPAAQAVRNRADYLIQHIAKTFNSMDSSHTPKFLSVASGPSMEWQRMIGEIGEYNMRNAEVHLLDQDENALKHAQRQLRLATHGEPNKFQFKFHNMAIKNVISRGLTDQGFDLIYSAGLFDYFSDPVAQLAGRKLYDALKPGGKLILGNFNVSNPNSMMMGLALDWHLIYRSDQDLHRLFDSMGGEMTIEKEDLDINLFCVITKPK